MKKLTKWVDPVLEKYREPVIPEEQPPYVVKDVNDLIGVLKRAPKEVLSGKQRALIASSMSFSEREVSEIMMPRSEITFVYEHDFLGPLMLDKLYQSGSSHFPVLSSDGHQVIGLIHTDQLNSLEIKNTDRATKYLDKTVYYLRADYSLEQAMAAFLRTNCFFFLVIDKNGQIVGLLTYQMLIDYLLGHVPYDDFEEDTSISAVMKRELN
ncbi:CBS domain-containing protein [Candidatus Saccharibacteria bacterium]|nr:CBS domain-containing protein [Candidatus Saccharibacteria bacterium]